MTRPLVLLTGPSGAGKSTACLRLAQQVLRQGHTAGGIVTVTGGARRYALDVATGEQLLLAAEGEPLAGPRWGRFRFLQETLDWGNRVVAGAIAGQADLVILDEIGPLELATRAGFWPALQALLASAAGGLLVVRPALVEEVRALALPRPTSLWTVTPENRDALPAEIAVHLLANESA